MSADLSSNTVVFRMSIVLMDDAIIKLEHGRNQDRIRKFMFESIEAITITRKTPWVRLMLSVVLLGLPGIGLLFADNTPSTVMGFVLIASCVCLVVWYASCGHTTIRITRAGKTDSFAGLFRPRKLRSFRERLIDGIRRVQQQAASTAVATGGIASLYSEDSALPPFASPVAEPISPWNEPSATPATEDLGL